MKRLRGPILTICLFMFAAGAASGQAMSAIPMPVPESFDWKWLVTQGGLAALTLAVLWSYRRDMQRLLSESREREAEQMRALTAATIALTAHSDASREQASAFLKLSESVRLCEAVRQMVQGER